MVNLNGFGLVYGSRTKILGWHEGLERPVTLRALEPDSPKYHITTVAFIEGILYDAGYEGVVRETFSCKRIGKTQGAPIFGISKFNGQLVAVAERPSGELNTGRVYFVESDKTIVNLPIEHPIKQPRVGPLLHRGDSLGLTINKDGMYVNSENITKMKSLEKGDSYLEKITDYLADFTYLTSNDERAFVVYYHSEDTNPDGTELILLPENKRLAFWEMGEKGKPFGYPCMVTMIGNKLIFGGESFGRDYLEPHKRNLYSVDITDEMLKSEKGLKVSPQLLLEHAFEDADVYGKGNPISAVPQDYLDNIIKQLIQ